MDKPVGPFEAKFTGAQSRKLISHSRPTPCN